MALLWLLPTLVAGVAMALFTHSWMFLALSLITAITGLFSQRLRTAATLSGEVQISGAGVAIGDRVLPTSSFFWRTQWRQQVLDALRQQLANGLAAASVQRLIEEGFRVDGAEEIAALAGFGANGEVSFNLAQDDPHLFVVGPTGSGKSRWLELFLSSLMNTHRSLEFWLADYKGGATLSRFASHPGCLGFTTDLDANDGFWAQLSEALSRREHEFAAKKIARIESAEGQFKRQIIVVDELLAALRSSAVAATTIEAIATRGRSLGMHLVVASQGTSGIGRVLLTNLRGKLVLSGTDAVDLAQLSISHKFAGESPIGQTNAVLVSGGRLQPISFPLLFRPASLPVAPRQFRARRQRVR